MRISAVVDAGAPAGQQVGDVLRVVSEPPPAAHLSLLAGEQLCVWHLQEALGVCQTLASHHLRVLRDAGLVETEPCGRYVYYRLRPGGLDAARRALASLADAGHTPAAKRPC